MKVTDIKAAITSCNDRIKMLESKPKYYYGKRQRRREIELEHIKIDALNLLLKLHEDVTECGNPMKK